MKLQRYDIDTGEYGGGYVAKKDDWAEWVRFDDVEKLEELNREMVEVLRTLYRDTHLKDRMKEYEVRALIDPFLAKAEGEGE